MNIEQMLKEWDDPKMSRAEEIFEKFITNNPCGRHHSDAYKKGFMDMLELMDAEGLHNKLCCPYSLGTAEADAWYCGIEDGYARWNEEMNR